MIFFRHYGLAAVLGLVCWSGYANATLGQAQDSIETDRLNMGAVRQSAGAGAVTMRAAASGSYTVQQIALTDSTVVREYVNVSGVVFGVAWQGASIPPLRQVLGDEALAQTQAAYQAQQAVTPRRGPVYVATDAIVFHSGGHPQAFVGSAYVPRLLPAGVSPSDIR
ncbi:DUF2844 domain-containing protein [Pararobbsia silviterrae]|uniref:DUF2844 domain-containing protein n=1 Tax=Pararobbsia silviterrae TaxID=1792498 RepID=A0A494X3U5_9BURK|nr:DUF2844 domain-containing protein [Pararobbsia silviterrae]RKP45367.1 DUF2844 domain-containing protein [Pararobbsia silviterrae]